VSRPLGPSFRVHAVRDAIALTRFLFVVERDGTDLDRPAALVAIGEELVLSLKMGRGQPDSLSYRTAVSHAARAMDKLASMKWDGEVLEMVRVAQRRVRGAAPRREDARDHKRHVRERRG
jgi:hypothetical protein